jgi:hypothetical protein
MAFQYYKKTYDNKLMYILRTGDNILMDAYGPTNQQWTYSPSDYFDHIRGQDYDIYEISKEEALQIVQRWDRENNRPITESLD